MGPCIFQLCFFIFFLPSSLAVTTQPRIIDHGGLPPKPRVPLFVFGDSLYDPGNNNYINTTTSFQANFLPYGQTFFEFATGRFSNGRIIPDFIAKYARLPLIPPYFQSSYHQFAYGVNFASGGGGALVETHEGKAIGLKKQLIYFKNVVRQLRTTLGTKETEVLLSNAVYMFSIGLNDLTAPNPRFRNLSSQQYTQLIIGNITAVLKEVYRAGGRKFGFVNLFPAGCEPAARVHNASGANDGKYCVQHHTELAKQFNMAFSHKLKQLEKQLKGFIYSKFDMFTASLERINTPSKYGFKEAKSACCGGGLYRGNHNCGGKSGDPVYELCENPEDYFFFDSGHPSEKAYKQFADLMWDGPSTFTAPYTLKSLFRL